MIFSVSFPSCWLLNAWWLHLQTHFTNCMNYKCNTFHISWKPTKNGKLLWWQCLSFDTESKPIVTQFIISFVWRPFQLNDHMSTSKFNLKFEVENTSTTDRRDKRHSHMYLTRAWIFYANFFLLNLSGNFQKPREGQCVVDDAKVQCT